MNLARLVAIGTIAVSSLAYADTNQHQSPYVGEEMRRITSLSDSDIEELLRGGGWGLAKPAELNGLPGPRHLLELQEEIGLSPEQVDAIKALHGAMQAEAQRLGHKMIVLERALDDGFRTKSFTPATLRSKLAEISDVRADLRFVHLSAHLRTPALLTRQQLTKYSFLRGYTQNEESCNDAPKGHDAALWRKHSGCD